MQPENARIKPAGTLIVGAGQAGLQFATTLRELGDTGSITLIGGEDRLPYQRPPLSKAFLQGTLNEDGLSLRGESFYADNQISLITGEWVTSANITDAATGAGTATTNTGRQLAFDHLALTTGGTPRLIPVPGNDLAGIHYLRNVADATRLRTELETAERVVVVGGGFIGMEAAAGAAAAGKQVIVVEFLDRLLSRAVAPETSRFYLTAHRKRGVEIRLKVGVTGFTDATGAGRVTGVELSDGRSVPADLVVVGVGLTPHTELAELLGLTCKGGIVIDQAGRTSIATVFAAGDCTVLNHPELGMVRLESVQNAIFQAKIGAATLLGVPPPETEVPWFWSDQGDLKLQIAGLSMGYDDVVVRGDPATESFSVLYYRGDAFIAIDSINAGRDYMAGRRILQAGKNVPKQAAGDPNRPLKDFL